MLNANKHHSTFTKRLFILVVTILMVLTVAQAAFAAPIDDKKKKAAAIAAEIDANGEKISALAESYNGVVLQLQTLKNSVTDAQAQLEMAKAQNDEVKSRVLKRAVSMYSDTSETDNAITSQTDNNRKDRYADIATGNDASTLRQLVVTSETVSERKSELEKQLNSISQKEKTLLEQKKAVEAANAKQQKLLKQTNGELANLIANARRAQAAATSRSTSNNSKTGNSNVSLPGNLPAPSPRAAIAIEFARRQLGKPYRYAAVGPGSYDCSGLTMKAWGAAGVSMPHYSGAQYAMFPKVPLSALQPGDLVFRGSGGSAHVSLYIGNGMVITAPQTGDVVKIASMGRVISYGARPG